VTFLFFLGILLTFLLSFILYDCTSLHRSHSVSGDVSRAVCFLLPVVCLARGGTGEISCKCLTADFKQTIARDLRQAFHYSHKPTFISSEQLTL
jgi:hypothetical protein